MIQKDLKKNRELIYKYKAHIQPQYFKENNMSYLSASNLSALALEILNRLEEAEDLIKIEDIFHHRDARNKYWEKYK